MKSDFDLSVVVLVRGQAWHYAVWLAGAFPEPPPFSPPRIPSSSAWEMQRWTVEKHQQFRNDLARLG